MNKRIAIILTALIESATVFGAETVGKVLLLEGKADAVQAAQTRALAKQAGVENADVVKTAVASSLQIGFRDSTSCTLGASSELSIDEYRYSRKAADASFNATLKDGSVRIVTGDIVKKSPRRFKLTTPRASIGIRGCLLRVLTTPEFDYVFIFEIGKRGSIEIASRDGRHTKTVTQPSLARIGSDGITLLDLPRDSYTRDNANLGIAQNGFGGDGMDHSAGNELRNLNDTGYLLQDNDLAVLGTPNLPSSSPADIDALVNQARENGLSLLSAGGGTISMNYFTSTGDGQVVSYSGAIGNGDYVLNFGSSSLTVSGSSSLTGPNSSTANLSIFLSPSYDAIKNGTFSVGTGSNSGIFFPNQTSLGLDSGTISLGAKQNAIDTMSGSLKFTGAGTANVSLHTGLTTK